jgi:hypothetical protein
MPVNRIALKSVQNEKVEQDVRDDLQALSEAIAPPPWTGTGQQVMLGVSGSFEVYATCTTDTSGSDGSNYHTVQISRNGAVAQSRRSTDTDFINTSEVEVEAYKQYFAGEFAGDEGAIITVDICVFGAPSPMLTHSDWVLRVTEIQREGV